MEKMQEMLLAAAEGSQEAFEWLYRETCDRNYYIALKMAGQEQDALDILQDAYVKIFQKLDSFRYTGGQSFASWTGKVVSNTALDFLRKKRPMLFSDFKEDGGPDFDLEDETVEHQPEMAFDQKETAQIVQELLGCLSEEQRICMIFRYVRQMKISEIAAECGCSENTIKSRLNYAKKRLLGEQDTLEKKGILLRGIAPFTLLVFLLKEDVKAASAPAAGEAFAEAFSWAFHSPDAGTYSGGSQGNPAELSGSAAPDAAAGAKTAAKAGMGKIAVIAAVCVAVVGAVAAARAGVDYAYDKMASGNSSDSIMSEREIDHSEMEKETETTSELEEETETEAKEEPDLADAAMEAYKREVLDEIYYCILDGLEYHPYDPLCNVRSVSEAGYELIDLDENGVPELVTSAIEHERSGWFRDLYTYADGKVVHLLESRARYPGYLCEGNIIQMEGSNSALDYRWDYFSLNNGELIFIEGVRLDEYMDQANPFFYVSKECLLEMRELEGSGYGAVLDDKKMAPISETEADSIRNRFVVMPLKLTTFEGYVPGVER